MKPSLSSSSSKLPELPLEQQETAPTNLNHHAVLTPPTTPHTTSPSPSRVSNRHMNINRIASEERNDNDNDNNHHEPYSYSTIHHQDVTVTDARQGEEELTEMLAWTGFQVHPHNQQQQLRHDPERRTTTISPSSPLPSPSKQSILRLMRGATGIMDSFASEADARLIEISHKIGNLEAKVESLKAAGQREGVVVGGGGGGQQVQVQVQVQEDDMKSIS